MERKNIGREMNDKKLIEPVGPMDFYMEGLVEYIEQFPFVFKWTLIFYWVVLVIF